MLPLQDWQFATVLPAISFLLSIKTTDTLLASEKCPSWVRNVSNLRLFLMPGIGGHIVGVALYYNNQGRGDTSQSAQQML
eukprot:scaffold20626_cov73-Cylindrotheca_fusiformis.AAC.1